MITCDSVANLGVSGRAPVGQVTDVYGIVASTVQEENEPRRQLSVDQEFHVVPSGTTRYPPAVSAPNSNAARRSSRSRSG